MLSAAAYEETALDGHGPTAGELISMVERERVDAFAERPDAVRSELGQYGTPAPVAQLMAGMFDDPPARVRLLDAGAGVGSLVVAFVVDACARPARPRQIDVTAVEVDAAFVPRLRENLEACRAYCLARGVVFGFEVVEGDFIDFVVDAEADLFRRQALAFDCAILNPPYRKIRADSCHRRRLEAIGVRATNLYAAFVALTARLLRPGGQMVAITPRSFCNGPYFKSFRRDLIERTALRRLHVFDSRTEAFGGDDVLQENVIVHAIAGRPPFERVRVSSTSGAPGSPMTVLDVPYHHVVPPGPDAMIHVISEGMSLEVVERMAGFADRLEDLGLTVSTGRVVDFRVAADLRAMPGAGDAPLVYPVHLRSEGVRWPLEGQKKPNAIAITEATRPLLVPPGCYVLVKRFSAKEQRRRIDAWVCETRALGEGPVGFENHLNFVHRDGAGLDPVIARGLSVWLNSTLVDVYFRLFSGHTQVNASDLRRLPMPDLGRLARLGAAGATDQEAIDDRIAEEIAAMAPRTGPDPVASIRRVQEARELLAALGFPKPQSNTRSALALLALLDLERDAPWAEARAVARGVTEIMEWFAERYGKRYAPNSRETVRRQTLHQFCDAGLIEQNPDDPSRPVNSGATVYRITPEALAVIRHFGTEGWADALAAYRAEIPALREVYAQRRRRARIPVEVGEGIEITLSPGGQNVLVEQIVRHFVPHFVRAPRILYVGDASSKWAHVDEAAFAALGLSFDAHGKFPDLVVHDTARGWLLLVEAVTSHGPVDPKRHRELVRLFAGSAAGLVFVTAFATRRDFARYSADIAWETEVWIAESPGHLIHFDGERFLGPYT